MKVYIAALLLVVTHSGAHAELFKWKDAEGNLLQGSLRKRLELTKRHFLKLFLFQQ